MGLIYKITNKTNGKVYIGLTTTDIKKRWNHHKTVARNIVKNGYNHPLYNSMFKYGIENFKIEEIDSSDDFKTLGELERKYINEYNSSNRKFGYNITMGGESNQLDANPRSKLTVEDVKNIRKIYSECKIGCKECWSMYSDRISFSAFEKVYEGITWKSVMPEVYTEENISKHRKMNIRQGEKNGNAILSNEKVYEIRKYYVNHTLRECYERYGLGYNSKDSFRTALERSYTDIPRYSKSKKKWFYEKDCKRVNKANDIRINNDIIEIDTFDDYGNLNGTFITDYDYIDIVKSHKWNNMNGKIYTSTDKNNVAFLHNIIIGDNRRTYYIDNNSYNVRKSNLTHSLSASKIFCFGVDKFKELCLDENVTLSKIGEMIGVSVQSVLKFLKENNIEVSKNKIRKKIQDD
jgi:group I intron endonuclease